MKKLNSLYFSARLQQLLAQLALAGTTLVVAPMGYGKTLAVNHFLQAQLLGNVGYTVADLESLNTAVLKIEGTKLVGKAEFLLGAVDDEDDGDGFSCLAVIGGGALWFFRRKK